MLLVWGTDGGTANGGMQTSFLLPLGDLGAGAVDTTAQGAGSTTATFTRATTAWTKLSTGLWASVASGTARFSYLAMDTTVGAYGGYLCEGARTNNALWSRDLTNVAWSPTNVSTAKTATGIDGVTNSATTLTATLGNGTLLQSITLASQANVFQPFVKRRTGTGVINITVDGGTTWTAITINSSTYTQVSVTKTAANPSIGFQIVTNGDAIDVDMADCQNGTFASTPIPTTTIAVARNADVLSYPLTGNISGTVGTAYCEIFVSSVDAGNQKKIIASANGAPLYIENSTGKYAVFDGATQILFNPAATYGVLNKISSSWSGSTAAFYANGAALTTAQSFDGDLSLSGALYIGNDDSTSRATFGTIRNVRIYPVALSAAQLQAMTT